MSATTVIEPRQIDAPDRPRPRPADPCVMVIFGASGDLTKRKLLPALMNLATGGLLPERFAVIAIARSDVPEEAFRRKVMEEVREFATGPLDPKIEDWIARRLFYLRGEFADSELYTRLGEAIQRVDGRAGTEGNVLFYLATPPEFFAEIVRRLSEAGLTREEGDDWRRVII
jgi:glucose-6-phosphate 1-dehydrogenase